MRWPEFVRYSTGERVYPNLYEMPIQYLQNLAAGRTAIKGKLRGKETDDKAIRMAICQAVLIQRL